MRDFQRSNWSRPEFSREFRDNADNKPDTLNAQLSALRETGFKEVDCYYKHGVFAIYGGKK